MTRKKPNQRPRTPPGAPKLQEVRPGPRELIVIARPDARLPPVLEGTGGKASAEMRALVKLWKESHAVLRPLFGPSQERVELMVRAVGDARLDSMPLYYKVIAPDESLLPLAKRLAALPMVAGAYVKPGCEAAVLNDFVLPAAGEPPAVTPDFSARQGYLDAAPAGLNARFAWKRPGGKGDGVKIVVVEGGWRFSHEDLTQNQGGHVAGEPIDTLYWRNHGTAVLGEFSGDDGDFGIRGMCPQAGARAVSFGGLGTALAIRTAADLLDAGDLLLIELHRPGPRFGHIARPDLRGYIAIEWWPDDLLAIQYATARGVVVAAVAGNGGEDLDDPIYDMPEPGFPGTWTNPFRRVDDSGSILVGAGAPPPGTHGHFFGPDRSRLSYSNWGECIDAQGWGREVTTTGYGDLQGGADEDLWYTDRFSGTSSATAMVVGALGCVQGALITAGRAPLTPADARARLRSSGSPQTDAPQRPATQRIGTRPDLRQIFTRLRLSAKLAPGDLPEGGPRPVPEPRRAEPR